MQLLECWSAGVLECSCWRYSGTILLLLLLGLCGTYATYRHITLRPLLEAITLLETVKLLEDVTLLEAVALLEAS